MANENDSLSEQRVVYLGRKLAMAMVYLSAIDDCVDPFTDKDPNRAWKVLDLVQRARCQLLTAKNHGQLFGETRPVIDAMLNFENVPLEETSIYRDCLNAVRQDLKANV